MCIDFSQNTIGVFFTLRKAQVTALIVKRDVDTVITSFLSKHTLLYASWSLVSSFQLLPIFVCATSEAPSLAAERPGFICCIPELGASAGGFIPRGRCLCLPESLLREVSPIW